MKKIALMIAAVATIFIAAPTSNADAQTVVIKERGGHHHGSRHRHGARAQMHHNHRGYHRGRGHGNKVIVIKKRYRSY